MNIRDFVLSVIIFGLLPVCILKPWIRIVAGPTPNTTILGDPSLQSARLTVDDYRDWTKRFADEVITAL